MKGILKKMLRPLRRAEINGRQVRPDPFPDPSRIEVARKLSHAVQGNFFGVTSVCALLKIAIEERQETTELVYHMMRACHQYKYALGNFVEYYRYEAGLLDTLYEPISIKGLITKVLSESKEAGEENQVGIESSIGKDMPDLVIGDETRVALVFTNLVNHAIVTSLPGHLIRIDIRKLNDSEWMLQIEQKGEEPTDPDHIFDLALEGGRKKEGSGGVNLDLFITRHLTVNILKGRISMSAGPDGRNRFKVVLPLR
ncbi:MAG: ATP-binding protein [Bacteroidota bacterium]|nr:ATP-binding protein [Bacteroidota bacterium]MDP4215811.1 ATP-binding protein [Bacteroidota bacterium]MDP4245873.1 ATP-binding protein [Bacteroidota bacterium]MDP4253656.1 ATP-binding protein [Bacteroidota bacterium]MDP4256601.1 ATP-binding protein [Bacteroidota bacterium]